MHVLSNWKYLHEWASEKLLVKDEEAKTCGLTHPPQIEQPWFLVTKFI